MEVAQGHEGQKGDRVSQGSCSPNHSEKQDEISTNELLITIDGAPSQKRRRRRKSGRLLVPLAPSPPFDQPQQEVKKEVHGEHDTIEGENNKFVENSQPITNNDDGHEVDQSSLSSLKQVVIEQSLFPTSTNTTLKEKKMVQCNICQRQMTESKLANHIRLLHIEKQDENSTSSKQKEFRCQHCGKTYAAKYTFEQHVRTHTEGRPKCPDCDATFASAFSLFRHRAKSHNLEHNYTTHSCDLCDKIFFSSSELNLHKQRHSAEKSHTCPECNKGFSAKGNLRVHMRTHSKEKLYKCDMCENTFSHPYSLVSHRRIHTNELPFSCTECGKGYRSKHQLISHQNVHSDSRPYVCEQCTKTFRSRTAFKMHQDQHEGIKRFACKFCDRKFQCHANKSKHERRHLGIKRFKCEICEKGFIERQELKNHQKVHAKQNTVSKGKEKEEVTKKVVKSKDDANLVSEF